MASTMSSFVSLGGTESLTNSSGLPMELNTVRKTLVVMRIYHNIPYVECFLFPKFCAIGNKIEEDVECAGIYKANKWPFMQSGYYMPSLPISILCPNQNTAQEVFNFLHGIVGRLPKNASKQDITVTLNTYKVHKLQHQRSKFYNILFSNEPHCCIYFTYADLWEAIYNN
ncbi:hypothetical protein C8Q75DRAFT_734392 [Abortiporus biennis]|nr:hypothetical protein C8Q75DRAFT_734392 [Abortiporus biennis]